MTSSWHEPTSMKREPTIAIVSAHVGGEEEAQWLAWVRLERGLSVVARQSLGPCWHLCVGGTTRRKPTERTATWPTKGEL